MRAAKRIVPAALLVLFPVLAAAVWPDRAPAPTFTGQIVWESDARGTADIFAGTSPRKGRPVVVSPAQDVQPALSRRGAIAFVSDRDGDFEVYVSDPDGDGLAQLTDDSAPEVEPSFSPDGGLVAFVRREGGHGDLFYTDAGGDPGAEKRLTHGRADDVNPAWSPRGDRVAFASNRSGKYDIWTIDLSRRATRLTRTRTLAEFDPAWSPDGRQLAFTRRNARGNYDIYVMTADGRQERRLTRSQAEDAEPVWSPDGRSIAFVTDRDGNYEIYVMNANGTGQTNFSKSRANFDISPSWQSGASASRRAVAGAVAHSGGIVCGPFGTQRSETIRGTPSADVICGKGGRDTIRGMGGNDVIHGGPGRDKLFGGPGKDRIVSRDQGTRDRVNGGPGSDRARTDGVPPEAKPLVSVEGPL
jgi:Tol biopolymer transport system component